MEKEIHEKQIIEGKGEKKITKRIQKENIKRNEELKLKY